jgi:plasmid maintenance system killer protein
MAQVYLLPYIKITHSIWLNGSYELIIGWWNRELVIERTKWNY